MAVLCVAGYIFFEITSFCLERNWSHVSIWRFWRLAVPFAVLQFFLCLRLTRHDALGCLLFISLCLGCREFFFQFQAFSPRSTRDGCTREKMTSAFMGGSAYGMMVALLCGTAGAMVHAVVGDGRKVHSAIYIDVLIAVALPFARNMARMVLNQTLAAATSAGPALAAAEQPKLDALVMYGDVLFLLTLFMEVPFAFVFILVPTTTTFCLACALNLVVDVIFVQSLDVVQRRDPTVVARASGLERSAAPKAAQADGSLELGVWSPSYCHDRPESIWSTLSNGALASELSETSSLRGQDQGEDLAPNTPGDGRSCLPVWLDLCCWKCTWRMSLFWGWIKSTCPTRCRDICCPLSRTEKEDEGEEPSSIKADSPMSPRVSLLLDEHNTGVISCYTGRTELSRGSGHGVFLRQERKIALSTHFLGSTLAIIIVTIAIPVAKYGSDNYKTEFLGLRHISAAELAIRAVVVLVLRVVADLVALRMLDAAMLQGGEAPTLWESRHELSTFHGWFFRALAATCPLFAVIAATL